MLRAQEEPVHISKNGKLVAVVISAKQYQTMTKPELSVTQEPKDGIDRRHYPQLDAILWDRHDQWISPEYAFKAYEQRWRYVSEDAVWVREHFYHHDLSTSRTSDHCAITRKV